MNKVKSESAHRIEVSHRLKSGDIREVEVFSSPLNYQGKFLRYSIAHDITARKREKEGQQFAEFGANIQKR